jgi:hypothetical protein
MAKYAIMRFMKLKAAGCGGIEAHNERTKSEYKSNPDIKKEKSKDNVHLVKPTDTYRNLCKALIEKFGCRTRKDSVYMVETVITASPDFFTKMSKKDTDRFFERALDFYKKKVGADRIISAVIHYDEKTPHMHLDFCPITKDGRLCAKEIIGNKKDLIKWQDEYHKYMSAEFAELNRGKSSDVTGRTYIPTQLFKKGINLSKKHKKIIDCIDSLSVFNMKEKKAELEKLIKKYEKEYKEYASEVKIYADSFDALKKENKKLQNDSKISMETRLQMGKQRMEYEEALKVLANIPEDVIRRYNYKSEQIHSLPERGG